MAKKGFTDFGTQGATYSGDDAVNQIPSDAGSVPLLVTGSRKHRDDRFFKGVLSDQEHSGIYEAHQAKVGNAAAPKWSELTEDSKAGWQSSSEGRAAIAKASRDKLANPVAKTGDAKYSETKRVKDKLTDMAFGNKGERRIFENRGILTTGRRITDIPNINDPAQRKVLGAPDPSSEVTVKNAEHPHVPFAVSSDFSHHDAMSDLIHSTVKAHKESLDAAGADSGLRHNSPVATTARLALERTAASAKAHSLGMKDAAVKYYGEAATAAGNLAHAVRGDAQNKGVSSDLGPKTMMAAATHNAAYKKSVGAM